MRRMQREKQTRNMAGSLIDIRIDDDRWNRLLQVEALIRDVLKMAQDEAKAPANFELSIVLTSDAAMQKLNREFRGRDSPTNVLSFPGYDGAPLLPGQPAHLGDIVLAFETLVREAGAQGKSPEQHLAHLLIHGFLHLLGYTHANDSDARRMEAAERKIMHGAGFPDPYMQEHE